MRISFITAYMLALANTVRSSALAYNVTPPYVNTSRTRNAGKAVPAGAKLARKAKQHLLGVRSMTFASKYKPHTLNLH